MREFYTIWEEKSDNCWTKSETTNKKFKASLARNGGNAKTNNGTIKPERTDCWSQTLESIANTLISSKTRKYIDFVSIMDIWSHFDESRNTVHEYVSKTVRIINAWQFVFIPLECSFVERDRHCYENEYVGKLVSNTHEIPPLSLILESVEFDLRTHEHFPWRKVTMILETLFYVRHWVRQILGLVDIFWRDEIRH